MRKAKGVKYVSSKAFLSEMCKQKATLIFIEMTNLQHRKSLALRRGLREFFELGFYFGQRTPVKKHTK